MKIGILTCWKSDNNYGQQLQCFALQTYLKKMGHLPYLIKYEDGRDLPLFVKLCNKLNRLIFNRNRYSEVILQNKELDKERNFDSFKLKYISVYPKVYMSYKEIEQDPPQLDVFIVGSDQVWKKSIFDRNVPGWFLDFVPSNKKRFSYAASFGRDYLGFWEKRVYKKYISKLSKVSVREDSGIEICRKLNINNAVLTVDPTLLFHKDFYINSFSLKRKLKNFFFCYFLNTDKPEDVYWSLVLSKSKKQKKSIIATISSGYIPATNFLEGITNQRLSIPEWLEKIYNADYVFTNSFHGVVFCLIFQKQFLFFPLLGLHKSANRRVYSLLERTKLSKRAIFSSKDFEDAINSQIEWNNVELEINKMRNNSITFLQSALDD